MRHFQPIRPNTLWLSEWLAGAEGFEPRDGGIKIRADLATRQKKSAPQKVVDCRRAQRCVLDVFSNKARPTAASLNDASVLEMPGGRTRARTWDPMIKRYRVCSAREAKRRTVTNRGCGDTEPQPTLNQRHTTTEREQTQLDVALFVNVFRLFRRTLTAHNGLVAGSPRRMPVTLKKTRGAAIHESPLSFDCRLCSPDDCPNNGQKLSRF
jgi:hypothetical protein